MRDHGGPIERELKLKRERKRKKKEKATKQTTKKTNKQKLRQRKVICTCSQVATMEFLEWSCNKSENGDWGCSYAGRELA